MTAEIIRSRVGQRAWCIAASVTLTQAQFTSASMQAALTYHSVTIPFTTRPTTLRLTSDFTCLFTGRPRAHWFRPRRIYALEKNVLTDQAYAWSFSVFFFAQNRFFWPSYCQISTDLDKILQTPIVVRITLVGRLRRRSARGRLQAKPKTTMFFSEILVTHHKPYVETTDSRDFGGKPSEWRWGRVLSWKIQEFCRVGEARCKNSIFRVLVYPSIILRTACYRKQLYPKPMVLVESRGSEGVPFASLESLWPPDIWQI